MAWPPRSVASSEESAPPIFPKGVRAVPRITVLGMLGLLVGFAGREVTEEPSGNTHGFAGRRQATRLPRSMPAIAVTARCGAPAETSADTRVVPLFEGEALPRALQALVELGRGQAGLGKVAVTHEDGERACSWPGWASATSSTPEKARVAAAAVAGRARELGARSLSWDAPDGAGRGRSSRARCSSSTGSTASSPKTRRRRRAAIESLEIAGERRRGRRRAAVARRGPEPRARPAEPALQRGHPVFLADRAPRRSPAHESLDVEVLGREAIATRAWARSPPWPRAATPSRS